jgi:uncharacterized protein YndB with AHSA1/START domain
MIAYAVTRPDTFRIARSALVKAPPEKIFAVVNDLRGWKAWSPYERKDPDMARTFEGPSAGKGAVYAWDGNRNVGQGRMEIIDVSVPSRVVIKLDFMRPFEAHNTATFTLAPVGDATSVTWAMDGPAQFVGKVMGIFFDLDKMIGRDFEAGLANLKALVEK